jgi:hypothetical protein
MYFDFLKYICLINAILFAIRNLFLPNELTNEIELVNFLYYIIVQTTTERNATFQWNNFPYYLFTQDYFSKHRTVWFITNIVAIVATILFGPFYVFRLVCLARYWKHVPKYDDRIHENIGTEKWVYLRRTLSVFIILVGLVIQGGIAFGITFAQNYLVTLSNTNPENPYIRFLTNSWILTM